MNVVSPEPGPPPAETSQLTGRIFGWAILALFVMVLLGLVAILNYARRTQRPPPPPASPPAAGAQSRSDAAVPTVRFTDITAEAGLRFVHFNGAYGEKLLPETMGGGCAFFDFDNDGDPDLLLVNGTSWPWRDRGDAPASSLTLYRNDGTGRFDDVTAGSGLEVVLYGMGCATGDFDNDGWVDVFVTAVGGNRLFRNLGQGRFGDVTRAAGVGGSAEDWSTSAAWFDADNDGDLDLFVCQYVRWSREIDLQVDYRLPGIGRAYGPPLNFAGSFPRLYRNDGTGRFTDISATSGLQVKHPTTGLPLAKSLGVAPVDLDGDGWMDLIVANDTVQNFVFHNEGRGVFTEKGATFGLAFDAYGGVRGAMGIDSARFEDDATLAISIGNFANEMTAFYVARDNPTLFTDEAIAQGIGDASRPALTFGVFFFDYDLDGWQDLLTANGHVEPDIHLVHPEQRYRQPAQLFWNRRGQRRAAPGFLLAGPDKCGPDLFTPLVGRGSAFADIDGDGDLDVLLTQIGGAPLLLRNDQQLGHHWVRLKLWGTRANRDAIGAWIKLRAGGRTLLRQVMPTRGYLSQSELPVTIGLGAAGKVDYAEIVWPGGRVQKIDALRIDALNQIRQAEAP
jgi:hypothetical protein